MLPVQIVWVKMLKMLICSVTNTESDNTYGESWLYSSEAATTPLYDGAPTTVLHALVKHFHWFSDHPGISKLWLIHGRGGKLSNYRPDKKLYNIRPHLFRLALLKR